MTFMSNMRDWRMQRRARKELNQLPDRLLHDAGIPRWRIDEISAGAPIEPRDVI